MAEKRDYYEVLGVSKGASDDEIEKDLNEKEYIIDIKKLKVSENNSKIKVDFFVSVYKDITEVLEIVE